MPYCPNCAAEVAPGAAKCPKCQAVFSSGSAWAPVQDPPKISRQEPETWGDIAVKVILRLLIVCVAGVVAALFTFAAMFAAFSGGGMGHVYLMWAGIAGGLIWVVYPIFDFAGRPQKGAGARNGKRSPAPD